MSIPRILSSAKPRCPWSSLLVTPLAAVLTLSGNALAQETISFPARTSDLPQNSQWVVSEFSEGPAIMDFNVQRWTGSRWAQSSGNSTNEQSYDWNVPLYAPASGEIASCWRNFPDDPSPGTNPPNNNIFTGGNHVVIVTDQGNAISVNHFKAGSIPSELCPPNSNNTQYPSTMAKEGDWRVASYINPANRPRVEEGEYLGRVGNSGNSGGPHLHMSMQDITGTDGNGRETLASASPMRFRHVWGHPFSANQRATADSWYRWRGGQFTNNGFKMVQASPYLRRGSASAGGVKNTSVAFLSGNRAVSAIIDSNNKLKLITWDLVGLETINRRGDISAGTVKAVQVSKLSSNIVLVAVRAQNDELKMIGYQVLPDGRLIRVAEKTAGKISDLSMTTLPGVDKKAVTAVRAQDGTLKLIAWDIELSNSGQASIVRLGEASAGAVSAISLSHARNFNGVFTAVRDRNNNLKVIPWRISDDGNTITRRTAASAGTVGNQISVAPLGRGVAVAAKDGNGKLRMITWSVSSDGNMGDRRDTAVAGTVSEINLLGSPHAESNLTAVVRNASGDLQMIGWAMKRNGSNLRRVGASKAGSASLISAHSVSRSYPGNDPRDMILTAMRDQSGSLRLIAWDTNLNNP